MNQIEELGCWKKIKKLGIGAFGSVSLWENRNNASKLAIKVLRGETRDQQWSETHVRYWKNEVEVMKSLQHVNVVRAFTMPVELKELEKDMVAMAMEYCNWGDLRNYLRDPEHTCGLPEVQIRQLALNLASGLEYLHSESIIHRDIKPENVMLHLVDDIVIYKIVDLGYCKKADESSILKSYVGTQVYLAPEVFKNAPYTKTVDFWSFGVLLFECITGFRPFDIPVSHLVESEVSNKEGYFYQDRLPNGTLRMFKELPKETQLSKGLAHELKDWLRLMLLFDPQKRGGTVDVATNRQECFVKMEKIMKCSFMDVYCMNYNQQFSFATHDGDKEHLVSEVQQSIEKYSQLVASEQLLIPITGKELEPNVQSGHYVQSMEPQTIFMFRKGHVFFPSHTTRQKILPSYFESVLSQTKVSKRDCQRLSFFCQEIVGHFTKLVNGYKAVLANLKIDNSALGQLSHLLTEERLKLAGEIHLFNHSLAHDLEKYEKQKLGVVSISSKTLEESWMKSESLVDIDDQMAKCKAAVESSRVLKKKIDWHRSCTTELEEQSKKFAEKLLCILQKCQKLKSPKASLPTDFRWELLKSIKSLETMWNEYVKELYSHLKEISLSKLRINEHHMQMQNFLPWTRETSRHVRRSQLTRQNDLWKIIRRLIPPVTPDAADALNGPSLPRKPCSNENEYILMGEVKKLREVVKSCRMQDDTLDWNFLEDS